MNEGAGLAAVSAELSPWLLLIVQVVVVLGGWKLSTFLRVIFK